MIIQVTTSEIIILLLYNIKLRNIQKTITAFENENNFEDQPCLMKVFFVNHTSHDGGVIIAASDIAKEISILAELSELVTDYLCIIKF